MDKIEDSINTLEDLDEFTNYILNPENQDSIIEVCDPTDVGQLADQFYDKEVSGGQLIFGPIWDLTEAVIS